MALTDHEKKVLKFSLSFVHANMDQIQAFFAEADEVPFFTEAEVADLCQKMLGETLDDACSDPELKKHRHTSDVWNDPVWSHNANAVHRMLQNVFHLAHEAGIQIDFRLVEDGSTQQAIEIFVADTDRAGEDVPDGAWCYACPDIDREPRTVL